MGKFIELGFWKATRILALILKLSGIEGILGLVVGFWWNWGRIIKLGI